MSTTFEHQVNARRYVMQIDNDLVAIVDYAINGDTISFTRTFTSPPFRGKGYAGQVVEFAANDVEANSTCSIVPMCWYVGDWFEAHPDRKNLLSRVPA